MSGRGNDVHRSARPARVRNLKVCQCPPHRLENPVVVPYRHATQIDQARAVVNARQHGRDAGTQETRESLREPERPPRQGDTGGTPAAYPAVMRYDGHSECSGEPVGTAPQLPDVCMQRLHNRRWSARDGRLERGEGKFVSPDGTGERVAGQPRDDLLAAKQQSCLRAAQQFVTAGNDDVGPAGQS
jgi:hypothetical protein